MRKSVILVMSILLLTSCAAHAKKKKGRPKWLQNPKLKYSEQKYLSAIGQGDSRKVAENMAAANLAKIFKSVIVADETISQRYQELTKGDEFQYEEETNVAKNVNIRSKQSLFNVQYGESYVDNLGRVYVIAYLNRMKTAQIYEAKIEKNAEKIAYYLNNELNTDNLIEKYASLNAASIISLTNEALQEQLQIIFPSALEILELNYDHQQLMQEAAQLSKKIGFSIDITNDPEEKLQILLKEMFTDLGFTLNNNPILKVKGNASFQKTDLKRDLVFIRYELQLELKDNSGNTIAALSEKGREGHVSASEAKARAIRTLSRKIKGKFQKKVINYFDTLISQK